MSLLNKFFILCLITIFAILFLFQPTHSLPPIFVLPHNPIFYSEITQILSQMESKKIKTVIIFGPNHKDIGSLMITDEKFISNEHSIGVLTPIIQNCFPQAEIIPFIFRRGLSLKEIANFCRELKSKINLSKTIIIASVDFSHYINESEARKNDQETLTAINQFDYQRLAQFGPEHLDCPVCLMILLELIKEEKRKPVVLNHVYHTGTSYFFLSF